MVGNLFVIMTIVAICVNQCNTSAIPMWEMLSRHEKMSHLYSTFANQVQSYCKNKVNANVSQCKKNMMMYGVSKLNDMHESHLDKMDPFQRNANNIIWDSMMDGHEDEPKATAIDERQEHLQQEQFKQQNPLFRDDASTATGNEETSSILGSTDHFDDDEHNNYLHAATNHQYAYVNKPSELDNQEHLEQNSNYLIGGMVQWMMPDGSPIKEKVPYSLPQDDDDMTIGKKKMPTMKELYDSVKTMDEEPKIIMELPPTTIIAPTRTIRTLYGNYRIAERAH